MFALRLVNLFVILRFKYIYSLILLYIFSACSSKDDSFHNEDALFLSHDGVEREYLLHIPENYDSSISHPIVFNFHGFGGTATDHMYSADLRSISDTAGFILVYPQGLPSDDGSPHCNIAESGGDNKSDSDDFGFIASLINELSLD